MCLRCAAFVLTEGHDTAVESALCRHRPPSYGASGWRDAVFIGLGSMIGAGVFSAFAPAAAAAGTGLLIGLAIAAVVAFCNATASAQLAAAYPTSGGTYAYGRAELGPWWGFIAGWCFVIGKLASCAAMALTFAAYAAPPGWERPVAIVAVAALVTVNYFGVTRTAQLTRVIVVIVLLSLAVVVAAGVAAGPVPQWWSSSDSRRPRRVRRPAVRRSALLRVRRIRAHRHDGRGGARSGPHDPPGDRARARHAVGVYAVVAVTVLAVLGPEGDGGVGRTAGGCRGRIGLGMDAARGPRGGGRGIPRRPARADRRHRPHDPRDGTGRRPAPLPRGSPPAVARAASCRARRRRDRDRDRRVRRPARCDRVLVVRRADLLLHRECRGVPADARARDATRAHCRCWA